MGIRLDWEVESDSGREEVAEDAAAVAAKERKQRVTRRALIVFAVLALIGGAVAFWRLQQVRVAKLAALEAIVQSETLALRLNDQSKFMSIQGPTDEWRAVQRRNFAAFQNADPRVTVTDEIIETRMQRDEARVTVRVMVGAVEDIAVWLYAYNPEKGWRHVGTVEEPWATHVLVGSGYTIEYSAEDEALATDLASLVKSWWSSSSVVTGDNDPIHINFVLDRKAADYQWANDARTVLIVPSRMASGEVSTKLSGPAYSQLAGLLADRWAEDLLHDFDPDNSDYWVLMETRQLMRSMFDPAQPRAEFYVRLTKAFGPDVLPEFFDQLDDDPDSSVDAMVLAMSKTAPRRLRAKEQLAEYLANYLKAEIVFFEMWETQLYPTPDGQVSREMFMETYLTLVPEPFHLPSQFIEPDSIEVQSVEQVGDLLWARATYITRPRGSGFVRPAESQTVTRYVPFRLIDGYWRHTTARADDWYDFETDSTETTEHLLIEYYPIDAKYVNSNLGLELEEIYARAAAQFGVKDPPDFWIVIGPDGDEVTEMYSNSGIYALGVTSLYVNSSAAPSTIVSRHYFDNPLVTANTDLSRHYFNRIGLGIVRQMFMLAGEMAPGVQPTNFLADATIYKVAEQLGIEPPPLPHKPEGISATLPQTLDDIWEVHPRAYTPEEMYSNGAVFICSTVLIEMLIEHYGIEALPTLTRMLSGIVPGQPPQATIDDWLKFSLNITSDDIEREWRVRCTEALVQYGYLPDQ